MNSCIVIIDDDIDTIECLKIALKRQAYAVLSACSGAEGLSLVRQHHPALVLTDVMMPDMDGYDVCRRLRADPATADVRIAMLSGRGTLADQTAGIEAGADKYIVKPVPLVELVDHVKELMAQPIPADVNG